MGNVVAQTDFSAPSTATQARAQRQLSGSTTPVVAKTTANFGDPFPGLNATHLAEFAEGLTDFQEVDTAASGLGPVFNNVSCGACHSVPAIGGGSGILVAPPPTVNLTTTARNGRDIFDKIGCDSCHIPTMATGPNTIPALDRKQVALYSDLLLHDMGSLGDGIAQGTARPREMRTAPLWGLRVRGLFLHDGRARSVDSAIRLHDGEADRARDRYTRLDPRDQRQLLEFLNSI